MHTVWLLYADLYVDYTQILYIQSLSSFLRSNVGPLFIFEQANYLMEITIFCKENLILAHERDGTERAWTQEGQLKCYWNKVLYGLVVVRRKSQGWKKDWRQLEGRFKDTWWFVLLATWCIVHGGVINDFFQNLPLLGGLFACHFTLFHLCRIAFQLIMTFYTLECCCFYRMPCCSCWCVVVPTIVYMPLKGRGYFACFFVFHGI